MLLIIGYGNSLRRDDGAGLLLAERLEQLCRARRIEVKRLALHQLLPELALEIAQPALTALFFVDARAAPPDLAHPTVEIEPLAVQAGSPSLGHNLDPTALLTYAALLYDRCPPAWLITAPGLDFGYGEGLSPTASQALDQAGPALSQLLSAVTHSVEGVGGRGLGQ